MRWPAERLVAIVVAAASIALAAGCSEDDAGGVAVRNIESDVVFGAELPNSGSEPITPAEATEVFEELPDQFFEPVSKPRRTVRTIPERECPPAALDEFPDEPAPIWGPGEKKSPPREGLYRWKRAGTITGEDTGGIPITVSGFERRLVRNVEVIEETETSEGGNEIVFTYEVVQPEVSGNNIVITTFQVKSVGSPPTRSVFNPTQGQDEFTVGEPERGLTVKRIEVQDRDGAQVSVFEPTTGLLLLPLRVRPGETWTSEAFDPRSGQRLSLSGKTLERERVDACGQIIEGWRVTSTLNSNTDAGTYSRAYDYLVAPQYGAILLHEKISQSGDASLGEEQELEFTIGQQDPDPLPPEAEADS